MTMIIGPCPHCCGEGVIWRSKWGGNDPDVTARPCPGECDDGTIIAMCDGWKCSALATEFRDGQWWCETCLQEAFA